jgi:hypothetical protein
MRGGKAPSAGNVLKVMPTVPSPATLNGPSESGIASHWRQWRTFKL